MFNFFETFFKTTIISVIVWYREFLGNSKIIGVIAPFPCRFYPTCSQYAQEAITKKGLLKGGFMSFKRILRCHPLARGGYDPVI
ncbi:MAG: membrane protein insertion efficiency factor YidD [Candidatus Terrybacteria bacterium RIFCSPLOWO2_01_FULL_44_24]|uniref:Putative membrane protein insertion efficiency factor n=1 Tax=Candidatus Terrybacteria bacterium RIFCSPHIGHO2_01_FULL_43_35 TaxID=1802361 RepID=A0A1G2PEA5_9BACT|nr:MAG: membrane protein insertion efficiency factor YidD [Candidatus Terrybacteria bacterium RIFCSPHIGHO2_01_FULL_43_35]OHA50904.1 MAG: membrane protein insertion efficiency factor YidD [Candidatus Terrybacteria bacterium RIFCSPLOWO2_01_FULL_44_24]